MAEYGGLEAPLNGIEGIDPVSDGENRIFWNDRFVEPKQQHRFTVHFPVYTPVGKNKDIIDLVENVIPSALGPGFAKYTENTRTNILQEVYSQQVEKLNTPENKIVSNPSFNSLTEEFKTIYLKKRRLRKKSLPTKN